MADDDYTYLYLLLAVVLLLKLIFWIVYFTCRYQRRQRLVLIQTGQLPPSLPAGYNTRQYGTQYGTGTAGAVYNGPSAPPSYQAAAAAAGGKQGPPPSYQAATKVTP
ncbi:uncharacterized protein LOC143285850 [Babylonia areolata]|uniref:uncharacterized protein LOC143285417 n=1 Tax=Babylonia areolata TaxID=304850 RepID=UPI003FD21D69